MFTCFSRLKSISALFLCILPTCASASGTYDVSTADGLYQLHTGNGQASFLLLKNGQVAGAFGELSDEGCNTRRAGSLEQTVSLASLFNAVEISRQDKRALQKKTFHANRVNGRNPFALSKVRIVMTSDASLQLTHTVTTYVVNSPSDGTTICHRHHHYSANRVNEGL